MSISIRFIYIALALLLSLGMWMSTGTMAMYAASHTWNQVLEPCKYLANIDHGHFLGTYQFLNGEDQSLWESSFVLRRLLYPLLAYPLMSLLGFHLGGVLSSVLIHFFSILLFLRFIAQTFDHRAALACALLLSTYPGIMYWIGLPYSYAMIVPCSLLSLICVWNIYESESVWKTTLYSLFLGVLFLGYDLLPYFGFAALILCCAKKLRSRSQRCVAVFLSFLCLVLPTILVLVYFSVLRGISPANANTNIYSTILMSYLSDIDFEGWLALLANAPSVFYHNFLYSNFLFLPILFLAMLLVARVFWKVRLHPVELSILFAVFTVWCFGNLAPPYYGWQIRGTWIARLYQPVFVVFLLYVSRVGVYLSRLPVGREAAAKKNIFWILLLATFFANAAITFGPVLGFKIADHAYHNFYQHSVPNALTLNIERFGRRPIGFCDESKRKGGKKKKKNRKNRFAPIAG